MSFFDIRFPNYAVTLDQGLADSKIRVGQSKNSSKHHFETQITNMILL